MTRGTSTASSTPSTSSATYGAAGPCSVRPVQSRSLLCTWAHCARTHTHNYADVNTAIDALKQAVVRQLKAGHPVFFGCDVNQFSDRTLGIMDPALFTYEAAFDVTFGLTKADRLRTTESSMTHAMVISGVHLDAQERPIRYKVENSWGPDVGEKGYFVMSDAWFEQWVYQVVVPKQLAPKELVKVFEAGEKVVLPAWDPMVSA